MKLLDKIGSGGLFFATLIVAFGLTFVYMKVFGWNLAWLGETPDNYNSMLTLLGFTAINCILLPVFAIFAALIFNRLNGEKQSLK